MASSPISNWAVCNRRSVRCDTLFFYHPPPSAALPPLPPLAPQNFASCANKRITAVTRLKQQDSIVGVVPSKLVFRARVGPIALPGDKIAAPVRQRNQSLPPQANSTDTAAYSSSPLQKIVSQNVNSTAGTCQKPSPNPTVGCTGDPLFVLAEAAGEKKRKFSLALLAEQMEQDFSKAKKLAALRSSEVNNRHQGRRKSSSKWKAGFPFRLSKEDAEQDVVLVKEGKRARRPNIGRERQSLKDFPYLIPAL